MHNISDQKRPSVEVIDFLENKAMWLPERKTNEVELEKMQFKVYVKSCFKIGPSLDHSHL